MGGLKALLGYWVEFRADDEAAAYGRYAGVLSQADLERVFFLDDENLTLVDRASWGARDAGFRAAAGDGPVARGAPGTFLEDPPEGWVRCWTSWPGSWGVGSVTGTGLRKSGAGSLGSKVWAI